MKDREQEISSDKKTLLEKLRQLINRDRKENTEETDQERFVRFLRRDAKKTKDIFPEMTMPGRCGGCDIIIEDRERW